LQLPIGVASGDKSFPNALAPRLRDATRFDHLRFLVAERKARQNHLKRLMAQSSSEPGVSENSSQYAALKRQLAEVKEGLIPLLEIMFPTRFASMAETRQQIAVEYIC
jgi:hypothetical protein